jgi:hypothetical protein
MSQTAKQAYLRQENQRWPRDLVEWPREDWPTHVQNGLRAPSRVWRSRKFLAQLFTYEPFHRLTVQRADVTASGAWRDGVTWDELQQIKRDCGFGELWAVEVFPAEANLVNVANMRHLWLLHEAPPYAWTAENVARIVSASRPEGRASSEETT